MCQKGQKNAFALPRLYKKRRLCATHDFVKKFHLVIQTNIGERRQTLGRDQPAPIQGQAGPYRLGELFRAYENESP